QVNVVQTAPSDWERRHWDLRPFITRVNRLKLSHPLLQGEGHLKPLGAMDGDTLVLRRADDANETAGLILINKVWKEPRDLPLGDIVRAPDNYRLHRVCRADYREGGEPVPATLALDRAEVAWVLPVTGGTA
ncbi:MAG TPA: hypothetical protein VK358_18310, partial [Longimicrobium sp.]|nr:hypothetical protein [Longimicrobium sp.]